MSKLYKIYARISDGLYAEISRGYSKHDAIERHMVAVHNAKAHGDLRLSYKQPTYNDNGECTGSTFAETLVSDDEIHIDLWETWTDSHGNPAERFLHKVTI